MKADHNYLIYTSCEHVKALAGNMNIEDITTDDDNRLILYRIRSNKEDTQDLYIQNEHEIEINEEEGTFEHILPDYVPEGVYDMGWLGYFIGRNTCLQKLYIRDFEPELWPMSRLCK